MKKNMKPAHAITRPKIPTNGVAAFQKSERIMDSIPRIISVFPMRTTLFIFFTPASSNVSRKLRTNRWNIGNGLTFYPSNFYRHHVCTCIGINIIICFYRIKIAIISSRNRINYAATLNNIWRHFNAIIFKFWILISDSSFSFRRNIGSTAIVTPSESSLLIIIEYIPLEPNLSKNHLRFAYL